MRGGLPEERVAAFGLDVSAVAGVGAACRAGGDVGEQGGCEGGVGEVGVGQAVAEGVLGGDVAGEEVFVVDFDAFGEGDLQEEAGGCVWCDGVEQGAVVGGFGGDGVGEAAGGGLGAVEDVDDGLSGFLAGEVPEDNGGDVRVGDEAVDGADAGVVDYDLGVFALACDVEDQVVGGWIGLGNDGLVGLFIFRLDFWFRGTYDVGAIPAFGCELVDKHEAHVGGGVHGRCERIGIPEDDRTVSASLSLQSIERCIDECGCDSSRSTTRDHGAVVSGARNRRAIRFVREEYTSKVCAVEEA